MRGQKIELYKRGATTDKHMNDKGAIVRECLRDMEDDLAIPMDFSGKVNMYKGCVVLFVWLNLIAHSIISHAMYFIVLLLHGLFYYEPLTPPLVNMTPLKKAALMLLIIL